MRHVNLQTLTYINISLGSTVGYHNEHHDFPFVAGRNLPKVRKIAAEFYDDLPQCQSWPGVIWDYIMNPEIGAFSRVKRNQLTQADVQRLKQQ